MTFYSSCVIIRVKFRYLKNGGVLTAPNPLDAGVTFTIYSTGNLTIKSNLGYNGEPYNEIKDIPQYIIISDGDINIAEGVANINAWLIAKGALDTCVKYDSDTGTVTGIESLTGKYIASKTDHYKDHCDAELKINGPVFANKIELNRTFGNSQTETAESFDLTPFSYYWAYWQARQNGNLTTTYTRELPPPRY